MSPRIDSTRRRQIVASLQDREYRKAFVADQIQVGVPMQTRALREQRGWSQTALGEHVTPQMLQEGIARVENPNKANLTIGTLLRIADAFDVALIVKFVPFSSLVDSVASMEAGSLNVVSFCERLIDETVAKKLAVLAK